MSRITTPLIMGVVFHLVITPMDLMMRLAGKDHMARRLRGPASSYRIEITVTTPKRLEKPFMLDLINNPWDFMRERKKFWLTPNIIVMLLLGALLVLHQRSAVAPFIYTLF